MTDSNDPHVLQHQFRQRLFFEAGLYDTVPDAGREHGGVFGPGVRHDAYCVSCRQQSTFALMEQPSYHDGRQRQQLHYSSGVSLYEFVCARNSHHYITFALVCNDEGMMKVGQWPSIAQMGHRELRDYESVLASEDRDELAKAIGLHAHGVGAGAFVYLRRILERFVRKAEHEVEGSLDPRAKMVDRITALKGTLPEFLTDNKFIYGILSKGIHELPEETCRAAFPVVRSALELIVEERLARKRKAETEERTKKNLANLQQQLESDTVDPE